MGLESIRKEPQQPPKATFEKLAEEIESEIDGLPDEIALPWRKRFEASADSELEDLSRALSTFMQKRSEALTPRMPHMFEGMTHLVKDAAKIAETVEMMSQIETRNDLYVAEGKTAHVFRDPNTSAVCHKFVKDFDEYTDWNSVDREAHFLEELEDLVVDGARTPALRAVYDGHDMKVITMELLDGPSIRHAIESNMTLPSDFDLARFEEKLKKYVDAMHLHTIYHRDLHAGNILIGPDSTPYIIDFGRSVRSFTPEYAYERRSKTGERLGILPSDEDQMRIAIEELRALVSKRSHEKFA